MTRKTQTLKKVKSQKKSKSQLHKTRKVLKHKVGGFNPKSAMMAYRQRVTVPSIVSSLTGPKFGKTMHNLQSPRTSTSFANVVTQVAKRS